MVTSGGVAVLGAGIMGCCLALNLARAGVDVTLVDQNSEPMQGASRWNEGKIHLGYLYGADPTLGTTRHLLTGGLRFGVEVDRLLGVDLRAHSTGEDDLYLIHRDSVVDLADMRAQFEAVSTLVREHPDAGDYLVDARRATAAEVGRADLDGVAGPAVVGGFRVPERSVHTNWLADQLTAAVAAEPRITTRMGTRVVRVQRAMADRMRVVGTPQFAEDFDVVVNALWEGRLEIDVTAGLEPDHVWSHRFRRCAFVRTAQVVDVPSAIVAVGPFGDVKNYNGRDFYLSWYPLGLVAEGTEVAPPAPVPLGPEGADAFTHELRQALELVLTRVGEIFDAAESTVVEGGYVFARGRGSIGDPGSTLHRRDAFGVTRVGRYVSVDTGKYSTAPWMARLTAAQVADSL
jgi:hypothetical protein